MERERKMNRTNKKARLKEKERDGKRKMERDGKRKQDGWKE